MAKYRRPRPAEAANACLQTHGGFGFANEYDVERKFRETRLYRGADLHQPDPFVRGRALARAAAFVLTEPDGVETAKPFPRISNRRHGWWKCFAISTPTKRKCVMNISHFDHLVLTVADLEATIDFYTRVLGMQAVTFGEGRKAPSSATRRSTCTVPGANSSPRPSGRPRVRRTSASSLPHRWPR